ncbi:MAG: hypothetical protein JNL65_04770 [Saprospiraceae bacterium]|nr:hypothetical protein [Saprospiraceae bacterium]
MITQSEKPKIDYAIYPNANGFGYVYMNGPRKLLDFGVIRINPICNFRILKKIKSSISYFKPAILILLDPESKSSRNGNRIKKLIDKISVYTQSENLQISQISRDQIRDVFVNFGVRTKFKISQWCLLSLKNLKLEDQGNVNFGQVRTEIWPYLMLCL